MSDGHDLNLSCPVNPCFTCIDGVATKNISDGNLSIALITTNPDIRHLMTQSDILNLEYEIENAFLFHWDVQLGVSVSVTLHVQPTDLSSIAVVNGHENVDFDLNVVWALMIAVGTCFCVIGCVLVMYVMPSIRDQRRVKKKIADGLDVIGRCDPDATSRGDEDMPLQVEDVYQRQLRAERLSHVTSDQRHVVKDEELQEGVKPMQRLDIAELDDALALSLPMSPVNGGMGQIEGFTEGHPRKQKKRNGKYHRPQYGFVNTQMAPVSL